MCINCYMRCFRNWILTQLSNNDHESMSVLSCDGRGHCGGLLWTSVVVVRRVCLACRLKCSRVDFEFRPCSGTHDRQCRGYELYFCTLMTQTTTATVDNKLPLIELKPTALA